MKQVSRRGGWKTQEPFPEQTFGWVCRSCVLSLPLRPLSGDAQLELVCKTSQKMLQDGTKRGRNSQSERKPGLGQPWVKPSRGDSQGVCLQPAEKIQPNAVHVPSQAPPI